MAPEASDGREMDEASPTWLLRQVPPSALRTDGAVQRIRSLLPKPRRSLRRQDNTGPRAGQARKRTAPQPDPRQTRGARAALAPRSIWRKQRLAPGHRRPRLRTESPPWVALHRHQCCHRLRGCCTLIGPWECWRAPAPTLRSTGTNRQASARAN